MLDQLQIGDLRSYDDFEASVKERTIKAPKKKSIKETVPFSNKTYDFSKINGEIYWEERNLEYIFEITADNVESLEEKKTHFVSWIMNVFEAELYDPFIPNYHFIATYHDVSFDDEFEKTTATVTFTAYPYMIANQKKKYVREVSTEEIIIKVLNDSAHRITPTFVCTVPVVVSMEDSSYAIGEGETTDDSFKLKMGVNYLAVKSTETGTINIIFAEEVF